MANYLVVELARDPDDTNEWFLTGRRFITVATGYDVIDHIIAGTDLVLMRSIHRQCDLEFGSWEGIELLPYPDMKLKPTLVNKEAA